MTPAQYITKRLLGRSLFPELQGLVIMRGHEAHDMPNITNVTRVMISSTARDLPDHRKQVQDACERLSMFPVMMERLPASDANAIKASLDMVDGADIYVGVYAHRYGHVP